MISSIAVGRFNVHLAQIINKKSCLTISIFLNFIFNLSYKDQLKVSIYMIINILIIILKSQLSNNQINLANFFNAFHCFNGN